MMKMTMKMKQRQDDEENPSHSHVEESKATPRPQLAHTARVALINRIAKYNDPHNLEWDWDDVTDKWERHALSAMRDLLTVEAERDGLARINESLVAALKNLGLYTAQLEMMLNIQQEGQALTDARLLANGPDANDKCSDCGCPMASHNAVNRVGNDLIAHCGKCRACWTEKNSPFVGKLLQELRRIGR